MSGGPPGGSGSASGRPGAPGPTPERRGLGGLITTEVDRVPLGEHQGRVIHGHIERRVLRIASGGRVQLSLTLGRSRATAVEIDDGRRTKLLAIPRVPDPWLTGLRRTALLWACSLLLTSAVGRVRSLLRAEAPAAGGSLPVGGVTSSNGPTP